MRSSADVVVCGAGIAGVAAAYHLAVRQKIRRVVIVDERDPLTLTSDKGTQAYRNWWPGPDDTMLRLVSRSIDLLEESAAESGNTIRLSRRGYLFATANDAQAARLEATANRVSALGMGPVRTHPGALAIRPHPAKAIATSRSARTSSAETKCTAHFHISRATPLPHFTCAAPAGSTRSRSDRGSSAAPLRPARRS